MILATLLTICAFIIGNTIINAAEVAYAKKQSKNLPNPKNYRK